MKNQSGCPGIRKCSFDPKYCDLAIACPAIFEAQKMKKRRNWEYLETVNSQTIAEQRIENYGKTQPGYNFSTDMAKGKDATIWQIGIYRKLKSGKPLL